MYYNTTSNAQGQFQLQCVFGAYFTGNATLNNTTVQVGFGGYAAQLGIVQYDTCLGTSGVHVLPSGRAGRVWANMNTAITKSTLLFGRTRPWIKVDLVGATQTGYYGFPADRVDIGSDRTWGQDGKWVAAHEYGHAFHNTALGGIGSAGGQCATHFLTGAYTLGCAYTEGFGDFYATLTMQDSLVSDLYETMFEDPLTWVPSLFSYVPGSGIWCLGQYAAGSCTLPTVDGVRAETAVAAFLYDIADNAGTANSSPGVDDDPVSYGASWVADVVTQCQVQQSGAWIRSDGPDHWIYCMEQRLGGYASQGYFPSRTTVPTAVSQVPLPPGWNADVIKTLWQGAWYPNGLPAPPALSAQLLGPSPVRPSPHLCTWSVNATNGVPPYTYVWKKNGSIMSGQTGVQVTTSFSASGSLEVTVTDNAGTQYTKQKSITVSASAPACQQ